MYQSSVKPSSMSKHDDLHLYTVGFTFNGKAYAFKIYHNLPDIQGLSFKDALMNWIVRTDEITEESLCEYIRSKNTGYEAISLTELREILKIMEKKGRDTTELRKLLPNE